MPQENIPPPAMGASHNEYAEWLTSNPSTRKIIKQRLGKVENLAFYAEIEEEEERAFLKDCDVCDLPQITHDTLGGCTAQCSPLGYKTAGVQDLFENITEGPDDIEKLSVALNEEIEKLPEFVQA